MKPFKDAAVAKAFAAYPPAMRRIEGNRAIVFDRSDPVPADALRLCIAAALTYHCKKPLRVGRASVLCSVDK